MAFMSTVVYLIATLAVVYAAYDYVKYGRADDGPFPSNLMNIPYYCYQAPSKGPCNRMYKVWFYDIIRRKCMPMFYSGCGGNENRFTSKESCTIHCERTRHVR
ncbi:unnamed protein product [Euphydryas editha]|uniref:BPTI/Kunitz inhibitor domain-containing protein n=1 Tax=Euphydryas editha TaxID=104508 RepID=A0AAU9TED6_EUPED|nr:unnamed protein product [Euphydryas editha]